ncbi:hypothetical protein MKW98_013889 [Papaver atlanticum]|uniref:S-protein homolog n=1 Tax=Papaver atlanticum TaxID=357466 RepID=A0AAD4XCW3_9MAGN|nr:hypothetical protein MKW98_013889 [Papaver atlanticum]
MTIGRCNGVVQLSILFLVVAVFCGCSSAVSTNGLYIRRVHVHLTNILPNNRDATVHCKSKENDLGEQTLRFGQDAQWDFHVNIMHTTLFWCNIWWYPYDGHRVQGGFHIYEAKRDIGACGTYCERYITGDGISFRNTTTGSIELVYPWPWKIDTESHH